MNYVRFELWYLIFSENKYGMNFSKLSDVDKRIFKINCRCVCSKHSCSLIMKYIKELKTKYTVIQFIDKIYT